ncbi:MULTISPECIES: DUF1294 domain-containing protein [unclassified Enterococcus]|jgi:uncharacterized membrane protein YsdA (DUF1294 family)|uniref:DUF1294 domain-containing protein n=1 Tax=unclassified Enterococcus TaxID=2608891 RepID=UPI003D29C33D
MNVFIHHPLWVYLIIVNLYLFVLMGYDKHRAKTGGWRVPEKNLLFVGLIGGGLGGMAGRQFFRHKTQKKKFAVGFLAGIAVAAVLVYFFH